MRQTVPLGRFAGVSVGLHWSVLATLPAGAPGRSWPAYWSVGVAATVLFLMSLLVHEVAHALVARHFRIRVDRVTLWLLGGVAELADEAPTPRVDLLVALAGPLTSVTTGLGFAAGTLAAGALGASPVVTVALGWLAFVNLLLAVFNLLPGAPLDGGRVLRALLWRRHGDRERAAVAAARMGHGLGLVLVFAAFAEVLFAGAANGLWLGVLGWFLMSAARGERLAAHYRSLLGGVPVRAVMHTDPVCGYAAQTVDALVAAATERPEQRAFPVLGPDGRPAGLVTRAGLARVPRTLRGQTTLGRIAVPRRFVPVVDEDEPLANVAPRLPAGGWALVVRGGLLVGLVGADDVARAAEIAGITAPATPL
jgi:Zn-dependent protease/CBS domain-containing protein